MLRIQSIDLYGNGKRQNKVIASCFDTNQFGKTQRSWCATCDPKAKKPGDVGYCGSDALDNEAEAPKMQKNSTNWGYCDIRCSAHEQNQMVNYLHVCNNFGP